MLDHSSGDSPPEGITLEGITRGEFLKLAGAAGLLVTASGSVIAVLGDTAQAAEGGSFSNPFVEPVIYFPGGGKVTTDEKCLPDPNPPATGQDIQCKPTAGSIAVLPDGRFLYWNALEGTENSELFVSDHGDQEVWSDQSRVLTLGANDTPTWLRPEHDRGGAIPQPISPLLKPLVIADQPGNNGTMFCANNVHLPDGSVMVFGGTIYYAEPSIELEGTKAVRVFDWKANDWFQVDYMSHGRWYPAGVPLKNGDVFVAGGVRKLEKPIYPDDPLGSGDNVRETETYSLKNKKWTVNGAETTPGEHTGNRSLPLMPRLHLLPNNHVSFNGAGQAWSPNGQSYRQVTWNLVATYDPDTKAWTERGFAGFPFEVNETSAGQIIANLEATPIGSPISPTTVNDPDQLMNAIGNLVTVRPTDPTKVSNAAGVGSRLSTFEVPLLLDPENNYKKFEILTSGGTVGGTLLTNPGTYAATNLSRIDTFTVDGDNIEYESRFTGQLNHARWFSSGVLLPNGQVMAFSGADRDEVIFPGIEAHIKVAELFDPATETWTNMAEAHNGRTYHNTAILMPDGRVLVGGHAPIPTGYVSHMTPPGTFIGPNDGRDPTFEIYSPPYASETRPNLANRDQTRTPAYGDGFEISTKDASAIKSVVLMRMTSLTHVNDCEQRGVKLDFSKVGAEKLKARIPTNPAIVPPGYWMMFLVTADGVPSKGQMVKIAVK